MAERPSRSGSNGRNARGAGGQRGNPSSRPGGGAKGARRGGSKPGGRPPGKGGKGTSRGGPRRSGSGDWGPREPEREGPKTWGGVARRGAARVRSTDTSRDQAMPHEPSDAPEPSQVVWEIETGELEDEARGAVARGTSRKKSPKVNLDGLDLPGAPSKKDRQKVDQALTEAATAFSAGRFRDARKALRPLVDTWPDVAEVRELAGLTSYRLERWKDAIDHLEAFARLTGSAEQHPPLADSHRALRHWKRVDELWDELRQQSPGAELVTEGRIVTAGSLADRGRVTDGIRLLERGWSLPGKPAEHHLRRAYALADLYERAGELPQARRMFEAVAKVDPEFGDCSQRAHALH